MIPNVFEYNIMGGNLVPKEERKIYKEAKRSWNEIWEVMNVFGWVAEIC
jgi:hypothetical protein